LKSRLQKAKIGLNTALAKGGQGSFSLSRLAGSSNTGRNAAAGSKCVKFRDKLRKSKTWIARKLQATLKAKDDASSWPSKGGKVKNETTDQKSMS